MKGFLWVLYAAFHRRKFRRLAKEKIAELEASGRRLSATYMRVLVAFAFVGGFALWGALLAYGCYIVSLYYIVPDMPFEDVLWDWLDDYSMPVLWYSFLAVLASTCAMVVVLTYKYGEFEDDCNIDF